MTLVMGESATSRTLPLVLLMLGIHRRVVPGLCLRKAEVLCGLGPVVPWKMLWREEAQVSAYAGAMEELIMSSLPVCGAGAAGHVPMGLLEWSCHTPRLSLEG